MIEVGGNTMEVSYHERIGVVYPDGCDGMGRPIGRRKASYSTYKSCCVWVDNKQGAEVWLSRRSAGSVDCKVSTLYSLLCLLSEFAAVGAVPPVVDA